MKKSKETKNQKHWQQVLKGSVFFFFLRKAEKPVAFTWRQNFILKKTPDLSGSVVLSCCAATYFNMFVCV